MSKNRILKTLLKSQNPMSLEYLSEKLSYPEENLLDYINVLEKSGLIISCMRPYSEELKYSPKRLDTLYRCSSVAEEYLRKELLDHILTVSSIIAAIASVAALVIA